MVEVVEIRIVAPVLHQTASMSDGGAIAVEQVTDLGQAHPTADMGEILGDAGWSGDKSQAAGVEMLTAVRPATGASSICPHPILTPPLRAHAWARKPKGGGNGGEEAS
jgi:hypothetical protein